ncbi:MAG: hypothetical protein OXH57_11955 [Ekhidna sp.]|nr:hypothetical protein [Ekhidna sp.]
MKNQGLLSNYSEMNSVVKDVSGINNFFANQDEATEFLTEIRLNQSIVSEPNRREYGDFQTNQHLAREVADYVYSKTKDFEFVLEPTCGKGNFILACISQFKKLRKITGVEIYKPYVWRTKLSILTSYLSNPNGQKPEIDIIHGDAFEFDYPALAGSTRHLKTLIIGNPPWVTNSELGSIESENLPGKSNFKKHGGLDAITGKGNFDIGEYISYTMLKCFDRHEGLFAFLIKNSIVKNIIHDQRTNHFRIGSPEKLSIDSKKEFNVSVSACLFLTHLNAKPAQICKELNFYSYELNTTFGWYNDKFVNSIDDYKKAGIVDGESVFTWRSGVKHDCSKVMELDRINNHFKNGLGEEIKIEDDLAYGLLKSSDLKNAKTNSFRKLTIITQKKIGQKTAYIENKLPLTYQYLHSHKEFFDKRKSSIYKDKPDFSIFGIGDYSFSPYKVAISGLYKSTHFTLVSPKGEKPIMLDDTCYFIGFDDLKIAEIAYYLVNSEWVQKCLKSIIFPDSKRPINKEILMRIDFEKAFENTDFEKASKKIRGLKKEHWEAFGEMVKKAILNK